MKSIEMLALASAITVLGAGGVLAAQVAVKGTVTDVFGHRYVVDEGAKKSLVDIGPKGADAVTIKAGDKVNVDGELTDAGEVRAAKVSVGDAPAVEIPGSRSWWERLTGSEKVDQGPFGPNEAKAVVTKAGYEPVGDPLPEKKHFEVLVKKDGKFYEVHAHRNGDVKHERAVDASNPKWGPLVK